MLKNLIKKIVPPFSVSWYHFILAFLSAAVYGFPSRELTVIGVTGTNGKTTTTNLAAAILEEAGYKVALASSIKFKIGEEEQENKLKMTMPGHGALQKFLKQAVEGGCQYAIIEATSEGVLQHRHRFIKWNVMVFTNLSAEHIERHGSFENYKKAKGEYFKRCKRAHIVNLDDKSAEYFIQLSADSKFLFGFEELKTPKHFASLLCSREAKCFGTVQTVLASKFEVGEKSSSFVLDNLVFNISLIGRFNVYNALAAICIGLSQGVSLETCQKALAKVKGVPGRMEEVISRPFRVVVDYAFTPNALEQVYKTLKGQFRPAPSSTPLETEFLTGSVLPSPAGGGERKRRELICVLGACGGGRDRWKRPVLGEVAAKYCKEIIITNEDPYDEPPMDIINQVAEGVEGVKLLPGKEFNSFQILDRREAIRKALELAKPGDTVIITGKGCEPWICVENGKKIPWDDRRVAREEFEKLKNKGKI